MKPSAHGGEIDAAIAALLDLAGATDDRDQLTQIIATAIGLASADADRLDLKIANAALAEMAAAFAMFAPYRAFPKVTMFGSARTLPDDPLYVQARELARVLADHGWMVITGAGPGIMAAGIEGAGRERSFGVNIRLPHEQSANEFIIGDPKLVSMKYFFTRKLELIKESDGFVVLPGGFGTLDEAFELLTLLQNGKTLPAPIVFLETPGGTYWDEWQSFLAAEVAPRGFISDHDLDLFLVTEDVDQAVAEIRGFYRNYHSLRWTGSTLVIRLRAEPTPEEVAALNDEFADLAVAGGLTSVGPTRAERADDDHLDLPRLVIQFDFDRYGRLRTLINALNRLASAPAELALPPGHSAHP
jgi:uncharacterized protein (TIGR00730 family)